MTEDDLKNEFKKETGHDWLNSQDEPDIDYVEWLEQIVLNFMNEEIEGRDRRSGR